MEVVPDSPQEPEPPIAIADMTAEKAREILAGHAEWHRQIQAEMQRRETESLILQGWLARDEQAPKPNRAQRRTKQKPV